MLFITHSAGKTPESLRTLVGAYPILLVGETDDFAERGGALSLVAQEEGVRLYLNVEAAAAAGLKVNSRLSNVARLVKTRPPN